MGALYPSITPALSPFISPSDMIIFQSCGRHTCGLVCTMVDDDTMIIIIQRAIFDSTLEEIL